MTTSLGDRNLFPHEFVHSWNGKYPPPGADLCTPDFRTPMRNSLLWVYEGQTQFWGYVLEARSGMSPSSDMLDKLAQSSPPGSTTSARARLAAAGRHHQRPDHPAPPARGRGRSCQRNEDYYNEGLLIWLEADAIIRQRHRQQARAWTISPAPSSACATATGASCPTRCDDVIATLNAVHPYDWAGFLRERVDAVAPRAPLAGFTLSGYQLATPTSRTTRPRRSPRASAVADFSYSLGFGVDKDGKIDQRPVGLARRSMPALTIGQTIVAVGERAYSERRAQGRGHRGQGRHAPIRLTVKRGDASAGLPIPYNGGLRYPRLVKAGKGEGPLDLLLKPR